MGFFKNFSRTDMGAMDGYTVNDRIRTGKVNIFKKYIFFLLSAAVLSSGNRAVLTEHENLSRFHIADELRARRLQRTALGGCHIHAVRGFPVAERAEAVRISLHR